MLGGSTNLTIALSDLSTSVSGNGPASLSASNADAIEIAKQRKVTYSHPAAPQIGLMALSGELLTYLMKMLNDPISILNLSFTCQHAQQAYHSRYQAHERQYHLLKYNLATPAVSKHLYVTSRPNRDQMSSTSDERRYVYIKSVFNQNLYVKSFNKENKRLRRTMPYPGTAEWKALRDLPLNDQLTAVARQSALIKKTYLTTWDLLLQPEALSNRAYATELMKILLDLSPLLSNAKGYVATLFNYGLSWQIFHQLAHCHLDWCIQLVAKHFPISEDSPGYKFIVTQLPAALAKEGSFVIPEEVYNRSMPIPPRQSFLPKLILYKDPFDLIRGLKKGRSGSVLFDTLKYLLQSVSNKYLAEEARELLSPSNAYFRAFRALLQLLFDQGCDLNQTNEKGETALIFLLKGLKDQSEEFCELVQSFLRQGADCNARDKEGKTPLQIVFEKKLDKVAALLLQHPQIDVNAICTVKSPYPAQIYTDTGSVLSIAIEREQVPIVQALLQHPNIDVNMKMTRHYEKESDIIESPLELSIRRESFQALLQHPAIDVNVRNSKGESALEIVSEKGDLAKLHALLSHPKIDVNVTNNPNLITLYFAIKHNVLSMVSLLTATKITSKGEFDTRLLAFNYAIWQEKDEIANIFLQGMDSEHKKSFLYLAFRTAQNKTQSEVVKVLLEKYAVIDDTLNDTHSSAFAPFGSFGFSSALGAVEAPAAQASAPFGFASFSSRPVVVAPSRLNYDELVNSYLFKYLGL